MNQVRDLGEGGVFVCFGMVGCLSPLNRVFRASNDIYRPPADSSGPYHSLLLRLYMTHWTQAPLRPSSVHLVVSSPPSHPPAGRLDVWSNEEICTSFHETYS